MVSYSLPTIARGEGEASAEFASYIRQRHYALCTVAEYASLLQQAGFADVIAEDRTAHFIEILQKESPVARHPLDEPTKAGTVQSWQSKCARAAWRTMLGIVSRTTERGRCVVQIRQKCV